MTNTITMATGGGDCHLLRGSVTLTPEQQAVYDRDPAAFMQVFKANLAEQVRAAASRINDELAARYLRADTVGGGV